jgi:hypothetical protein
MFDERVKQNDGNTVVEPGWAFVNLKMRQLMSLSID